MAICEICKQEMMTSDGCVSSRLFIDGQLYNRLQVRERICSDCGAKASFYHHFGCDQEVCQRCGNQLLLFNCENVGIEICE